MLQTTDPIEARTDEDEKDFLRYLSRCFRGFEKQDVAKRFELAYELCKRLAKLGEDGVMEIYVHAPGGYTLKFEVRGKGKCAPPEVDDCISLCWDGQKLVCNVEE